MLLVATSVSLWAQEQKNETQKITVAVLNLEGRGISAVEAATLTDRLRSMLVKTKVFAVVDRGRMEAILQEVGFQQTGCTSSECAVEVGRILNVQQMITGSVGKVGDTYTLDLSAIDVTTSQIINTTSRDYEGRVDGLLKIMQEVANQLAGIQAGPSTTANPPAKAKSGHGNLVVTSAPEGAEILVDGITVGRTPKSFSRFPAGEHQVKLTKAGYAEYEQTVLIEADKTATLRAKLGKASSKAELASEKTEKKGGGKTALWVGLGAVAVGGGVAAVMLAPKPPDNNNNNGSSELPAPSGRP
jgi:TolB-like protein